MMMKKIILMLIGIVLVSCSTDNPVDATVVQIAPRSVEDVTADFLKLDIQPGVNDLSLESLERGTFWNFRVIAPTGASDANKKPLVLALHGASGGSSTAHQSTNCYVEPGLASLDAFIISPNAGTGEWYDEFNQIQVSALVDLARRNWFVDTEKVLVMGYSNGGNASWLYADFFPQYFTAAIAMASSYNPERADGSVTTLSVPLYVIHSDSDELFPVAQTQAFVNKAKDAGSVVEFVIIEGLSHYKPCDYVSALQEGVDWVETNVW